jgi:uncharacterized membrane protein YecN with MAPEG domain
MKINEGTTDRWIRAILGIVLLIVGIVALSGTWAWIVGIVGVILLITAVTGFCGLYAILGTRTNKSRTDQGG